MNVFAPIAKPAFAWIHNTLMDEGARALASLLGVNLLAAGNVNLN